MGDAEGDEGGFRRLGEWKARLPLGAQSLDAPPRYAKAEPIDARGLHQTQSRAIGPRTSKVVAR